MIIEACHPNLDTWLAGSIRAVPQGGWDSASQAGNPGVDHSPTAKQGSEGCHPQLLYGMIVGYKVL